MRYILSFLLIITFSLLAQAQMEKYKAIFLYKFAQNFEWPSDKISENYKIGIFGDVPLYDELIKLTNGRTINGKSIEVVKYTPGNDLGTLCILFISDKNKDTIELMSKAGKASNTVIVGESPGLSKKGACINFISNGNSLKFELNETNLKESKVKASGSIKSLAILVN
ncbi:MAG: YfiR family protein [Ekhidna sp.]